MRPRHRAREGKVVAGLLDNPHAFALFTLAISPGRDIRRAITTFALLVPAGPVLLHVLRWAARGLRRPGGILSGVMRRDASMLPPPVEGIKGLTHHGVR